MPDTGRQREKVLAAARAIRHSAGSGGGEGFRVVVTGKGGVGKTTITAALAHLFARKGYTALAVDADPQMNLPFAIGVPTDRSEEIVPLTENLDYIEEKTGARPGAGWGLMLKLNPDAADVVDRFGVTGPGGVKILVMGTVVQAATGCLCPENTLLDAVVHAITLRKGEVILMDTQAGVEHFGRSLAKGFSQALLVTDPSFNALTVVKHAAALARELGIPHVHLVVNRVRSDRDMERVREILGSDIALFTELFWLPYDERLLACDPGVLPLLSWSPPPPFLRELVRIRDTMEKYGTR